MIQKVIKTNTVEKQPLLHQYPITTLVLRLLPLQGRMGQTEKTHFRHFVPAWYKKSVCEKFKFPIRRSDGFAIRPHNKQLIVAQIFGIIVQKDYLCER